MDVLIVGASGGIGRYLFKQFSPKYHTYGTYCHGGPPFENCDTEYWRRVDVLHEGSTLALMLSLPGIQDIVLVNTFGISLNGMGHKLPSLYWDDVVNTNVRGAWLVCKAFLPVMRKQGWGRIINFSSVVGRIGVPGTCAYSASKAGLEGLTRSLAVENATKGITVNCLSLGYFEAGMINTLSPEMRESVTQSIPMKRLGDLHSIEAAIEFLITADYVTGTTLRIDGGLA